MKPFRLLLLLLLAGCEEFALDKMGGYNDVDSSAGAYDSVDSGGDSGAPRDPAWYVVRAELTVAGGAASAENATVRVEVVDADLERTDCGFDLAPEGVVPAEADTADPTLWWDVTVLLPDDADPCATLPATISLGIGELHPDVRAQLGTVGLDAVADSLYGASLRADGGEAVAFGYAGTAADLSGDDAAMLPPPDGAYQLSPLYLVALPE